MKKNPPDGKADHYYEIEMTPRQREAFLRLCEGKGIKNSMFEAMKSAILDARKIEGRLPRARLEWDEISKEAKRQGCSEADVVFDRAHGGDEWA